MNGRTIWLWVGGAVFFTAIFAILNIRPAAGLNQNSADVGFALIGLLIIIYFVPTLTAVSRGHRNKMAVFLLNLCLGWTLIGWVVALVWATMSTQKADRPIRDEVNASPYKRCPDCAEEVRLEARRCRFCGAQLPSEEQQIA